MWSLSHSHEGMVRRVSGSGWTHTSRSWAGPGARVPHRWTRLRNPANASWPVTFCSMIGGHQRLHHQAGAAQPPVGVVTVGVGEDLVARLEAARVVVGTEQRRHRSSAQSAPSPHAAA